MNPSANLHVQGSVLPLPAVQAPDPPGWHAVEAAAARLRPHIRITPVIVLRLPTPAGCREIHCKLELMQVTGVFKVRGAFNALLQCSFDAVIACSRGNHGLAVAYAAKALGKKALIYVPKSAARTKVEGMKHLGAEIRMVGHTPKEAFQAAHHAAQEKDLPMIHPYDQAEVIAG